MRTRVRDWYLARGRSTRTLEATMSAPADSLAPVLATPRRVRVALALLWAAWAVSACTLTIRVVFFHLPLGWLGFAGVAIQGLIVYFIGRRSNAARIIMLIIVLINTASAYFLWKVIAEASMSATPTVVGYLLRVAALVLLFSGESRQWFRGPHALKSGL
jgi:hypothetical protein